MYFCRPNCVVTIQIMRYSFIILLLTTTQAFTQTAVDYSRQMIGEWELVAKGTLLDFGFNREPSIDSIQPAFRLKMTFDEKGTVQKYRQADPDRFYSDSINETTNWSIVEHQWILDGPSDFSLRLYPKKVKDFTFSGYVRKLRYNDLVLEEFSYDERI